MKNRNITTRIIAGAYKGKTLALPSLETTRSSKSILKESFFNRLQFDIMDAIFVELFAGSGSIGLEALSRGAKRVYFFEKDSDSFKVLKANIALTNPQACEARHADVFEALPELLNRLEQSQSKAYFYIDPPFSIREGMEDIYDKMIALIASIPESIVELIAIEHMSELKLPQSIGPFDKSKSKKFGKTTMSYYEAQAYL